MRKQSSLPYRTASEPVDPAIFAATRLLEENMEHSGSAPLPYMNRRAAEKQMLSLICTGNTHLLDEQLKQNMENASALKIGTMSRDSINQQRYLCIVIIAIICRAVIDYGVPENIAFSLSDSFIQQADQMYLPEQLIEFSGRVMRMYCQAVQDHRLRNASPPIRKCCDYMMLKLHSTISLQELSDICHLSPNYVSDLFRKEMGISAMQFYHQCKLQYAKHLILHTDWSIAHISAQLSYPSQSNFTERFKKNYGTTPMQFRLSQTAD